MQSISVFLDIAKFTNFWCKNADANRTQEVCHVIYVFSRSSLENTHGYMVNVMKQIQIVADHIFILLS